MPDFNLNLINAAGSGDYDGVLSALASGATEIDFAMAKAGYYNHLDVVQLCSESGATNYEWLARVTSHAGNTEILDFAISCGAWNFGEIEENTCSHKVEEVSTLINERKGNVIVSKGGWKDKIVKLDRNPHTLCIVSHIDGTTSGAVKLFTVPKHHHCYVTEMMVELTTSVPGGGNTEPTIKLGTNATNYDNIYSTGASLTQLTSVDNTFYYSVFAGSKTSEEVRTNAKSEEDIFLNISVASNYTTYEIRVILVGLILEDLD
jgi:hypothetical protein